MEGAENDNLEKYIFLYLDRLRNLASMNSSQIEETEDYLFSESSALMKDGLSAEEAVAVAKIRLGTPEEISAEYRKVQSQGFLLNIALYTLLGLLVMKTVTLICKLPVFAYLLMSDIPNPSDIRIGASLITASIIIAMVIMIVRTSSLRSSFERLIYKWYFPLFYAFIWLLDHGSFMLLGSSSSFEMAIGVSGILYIAYPIAGIAIYCFISIYLLVHPDKSYRLKLTQ